MQSTDSQHGGATFDRKPPDQVDFDAKNPRFGGLNPGSTQKEIAAYLMGEPHYASELVDSLLQNGFIEYEPLIVRRTSKADEFVVVEGNRRLAAVKHIRANAAQYAAYKEKVDSLNKVPVMIFASKGQEDAQRVYLGVRHLFGYREWPPLSKAKFLHNAIKNEADLENTVRELGIKKQEISHYLIPYRILVDIKVNIPKGEDFWVLGESLSRGGIKKYIQLDIDPKSMKILGIDKRKLGNLLDYIYGKLDTSKKLRDPSKKKISDTRQLKDLATVLSTPKACAAFERGADLDTALLLVETREQSVRRLGKTLVQIRKLLMDGLKLNGAPTEVDLKRPEPAPRRAARRGRLRKTLPCRPRRPRHGWRERE